MSGSHHDHHQATPPATDIPPLRLVSNYTDGGHEIDSTPDKNLFAFLGVMVVILIAASIGVYQLFVVHTDGQLTAVANVPAEQLEGARAHAADLATTWGKTVKDGVVTYRMPYADAKRLVLSSPDAFRPAPPPAGWVHPDDAK